MTRGALLNACVAFSLCAHFFLVHLSWSAAPAQGGEQTLVPADFEVAALPGGDALSLGQAQEQAAERDSDARGQADRRRQALRQYLAAVRKAIEQRKFPPGLQGQEGLIGNAAYAFTITAAGAFVDITPVRGSGDARLDSAALSAIRAASGAVERPKATGRAPLRLAVTVKYQHSL